jgi:hypothetical protein
MADVGGNQALFWTREKSVVLGGSCQTGAATVRAIRNIYPRRQLDINDCWRSRARAAESLGLAGSSLGAICSGARAITGQAWGPALASLKAWLRRNNPHDWRTMGSSSAVSPSAMLRHENTITASSLPPDELVRPLPDGERTRTLCPSASPMNLYRLHANHACASLNG